LIGAKSKSHILCENEFKKLGAKVYIATEDGSRGRRCLVTDILKELLYSTLDTQHPALYACGPVGMLKAVAGIAGERNVPCQVSLEERMACGVGVCLGCPVKVLTAYSVQRRAQMKACILNTQLPTQYEYKMVCKDGPVFDAEEIFWE
jgi:dihydroorotate dehydrogenase electron transfer subunit